MHCPSFVSALRTLSTVIITFYFSCTNDYASTGLLALQTILKLKVAMKLTNRQWLRFQPSKWGKYLAPSA